MQVTLFDIFNSASKATLDKLVGSKMKDPKAVYTMVKLSRKIEQEAKNLDETIAQTLSAWEEYEGLKARSEEIKAEAKADPLMENKSMDELREIDRKVNAFIGGKIDEFTKNTVLDLAVSPIKIGELIDLGLTNAEIVSVDWLVDFGGEVEN
jgi:hypothetical protein